jgi:hypothetical protein
MFIADEKCVVAIVDDKVRVHSIQNHSPKWLLSGLFFCPDITSLSYSQLFLQYFIHLLSQHSGDIYIYMV